MIDRKTFESLPSVIHRLGTPPPDIVDAWCQQLASIATVRVSQNDDPIDAIWLSDCQVNDQGQIVWLGETAGCESERISADSLSRPLQSHIDRFRDSIMNRSVSTDLQNLKKGQAKGAPTRKKPRTLHRSWKTTLVGFALVIAGCVAGVAYTFHRVSSDDRDPPHARHHSSSAVVSPPAPDRPGDIFTFSNKPSADKAPADKASAPAPAPRFDTSSTRELETIESSSKAKAKAEVELLKNETSSTKPDFSLGTMVPDMEDFAPSIPTDLRQEVQVVASESEQSTEIVDPRESIALELPPMPDGQARDEDKIEPAFVLANRIANELELSFPYDVPLTMTAMVDQTWIIRDTRQSLDVTTISSGDETLAMRWSGSAKQSASAGLLAHGRLRDESGNNLYLRPKIVASPYMFDFAVADTRPTWNLRAPIPPKVSRLSIEIDLPETLELGWIQPIATDSIRRGRGMAVLSLVDDEHVSLGVRFDVRCSRKLECRLRFAARLDPSTPWASIATSDVQSYANQLTHQAVLIGAEARRLADVYEIADAAGRRIIKIKQRRNDAVADQIRTTSGRVAQLQSLMATAESSAAMRLKVWVDWPDAEQILLVMPPRQ